MAHKRQLDVVPDGVQIDFGKVQIDKIFNHECGCCEYHGNLLKDGQIFDPSVEFNLLTNEDKKMAKFNAFQNLTCIKGSLYTIQKIETNRGIHEYDDTVNDELEYSDIEDNGIDIDINHSSRQNPTWKGNLRILLYTILGFQKSESSQYLHFIIYLFQRS